MSPYLDDDLDATTTVAIGFETPPDPGLGDRYALAGEARSVVVRWDGRRWVEELVLDGRAAGDFLVLDHGDLVLRIPSSAFTEAPRKMRAAGPAVPTLDAAALARADRLDRKPTLRATLAYFEAMSIETAKDPALHDEAALWRALAADVRAYLGKTSGAPQQALWDAAGTDHQHDPNRKA